LAFTWLLALASFAGAQSSSAPDYRIGDTANADVIAPVELFVFDPERTEQARKAEAARVPPIFLFDPTIRIRSEEQLSAAFVEARDLFVRSIEDRFHRRIL